MSSSFERGQEFERNTGLRPSNSWKAKQLVKGSIEEGEQLPATCERELFEEAGIEAEPIEYFGKWEPNYQKQVWELYLMECKNVLPDRWEYYTQDDCGHIFEFFWQPLDQKLSEE